jgi:tRNA (guanosine-2'-O-)-methyltransferase
MSIKRPKRPPVQGGDIDALRAQITPERAEKLRQAAFSRQRGLTVIMDDVWNPHNLAAIARTADSLGVQQVHYTAPKAFDPALIGKQSSAAANKWVDYHYEGADTPAAIAHLQAGGWQVVATVMSDDAHPLYSTDWTTHNRLAILVGNEHAGVDEEAAARADLRLTIPMRGIVQSLNVSVATALILAEITRQRDLSGRDFHLPPDQAAALFDDFIRRAY